jgi:uncharacterized protein YdeI (YjbR/CyaY-like superfamily)
VDLALAIPVAAAGELEAWLAAHGCDASEVVVAIFNKASGRQTVSLEELQEAALCHGWVDTQTRRIDEASYAIRFVPRRPRSTWSPKNREMARRLVEQGRVAPAGLARLPPDL